MGESNSSPLSIDTPPINPVIANQPAGWCGNPSSPVADRFPFLVFNFLSPQEKGAAAAAPQKL